MSHRLHIQILNVIVKLEGEIPKVLSSFLCLVVFMTLLIALKFDLFNVKVIHFYCVKICLFCIT